MKTISLLLTLLVLGLTGAALVPALATQTPILTGAAAALALVLLILHFLGGKKGTPPPPASAPTPPPAPRPEAEIVGLLAVLQEKGRFVDFLMEDVTSYTDAQVGAAARVVHQGCQAVLRDHFAIEPMCSEAEGSSITVPAQHAADEFRLTGNLGGTAPFTGTLVHKGWKATAVKLPRLLIEAGNNDHLPAIAPAEVDVK